MVLIEKTLHVSLIEYQNSKVQTPNYKWFDKLTTLSQVEGYISNSNIQ